MTSTRRRRDALHLAHPVPVQVFTEQFGPERGLVSVSPVVEERNVDSGACGAARVVAHQPRSKGTIALDGGHRHASGEGSPMAEQRSITRAIPMPNQGRRANRLRGRHWSAALRACGSRIDVRSKAIELILEDLSRRVLTNASNSCSWTAAPRRRRHIDSRPH